MGPIVHGGGLSPLQAIRRARSQFGEKLIRNGDLLEQMYPGEYGSLMARDSSVR